MKKKIGTLYLVLIVGAVLLIGIIGLNFSYVKDASEGASIITATVDYGNIRKEVLATGILEPYELVSVGAQTSGRVTNMNVKLGQFVNEGDLIAEIDSASQKNVLETANAKIASMNAQIEQAKASLEEKYLSYDRQKKLYAASSTSKSELEAAEAAYKTSSAGLKYLEAQLVEANVTRNDAELNLKYTRITAPISGNVLAIVTKAGQTINSNQTAPTIVKLGRTDRMTVKAEISEADVIHVKPGMPIYFTILGDPERKFEAVLRSVALAPTSIEDDDTLTPSTNSNAIYYNGIFDVDNSDGILRTFMTAQISIILDQVTNILVIPSTALGKKNEDETYQVKVLENSSKITIRNVKIGVNDGTNAQIVEGLSKGEKVITIDATNREPETGFKGPPKIGGL
ncbi:MAG: efflux RND transporter periplasmic adaptor subunit [Pseudobdellovibrionaceae bacterium]